MIDSLDQLRALAAVVDNGTFDAAAAALHVTPSAISQRIKQLETQVGKVLIQRGKPATPTDAGRIMLRLARQITLLEQEAAEELGVLTPGQGRSVPLVVNADSLATWALHPLALLEDVDIEVLIDDQDHTTGWLREGIAMAAVTSDIKAVPGCRVSPLGTMRYRPAANPDFARRWFPEGVTREALMKAPLLIFNRKDFLQNRYLEQFLHAGDPLPPLRYIPSSTEFVKAAELGLGWLMAPELQLEEPLERGDLVLLDHVGYVDITLHWQQWAVNSVALDKVARSLLEEARRTLRPI